ncbi:hypothetical protein AAVH_38396 [Aphelenchoides avenae]|nr:hypothetical protein AAVH_38396 [Aphelenchus avenae]
MKILLAIFAMLVVVVVMASAERDHEVKRQAVPSCADVSPVCAENKDKCDTVKWPAWEQMMRYGCAKTCGFC